IAIGYLIGRIKIGFFQLGSVAGTLLAACVVGQAHITVSPQVKAVCFALFIFSVGFKSGPQFFASLNKASVKPILLSIVVCVTGLLATFGAAKAFKLDVGTAAGVLAGACTESASIGTAGEAISRLDIDEAEKQKLQNNIAVGYAMTYLFGTLCVILFVRSLAPKLLGINLRQSAREYEEKHGGGAAQGESGVAYMPIAIRAFRVAKAHAADGAKISAVTARLGEGVAIGRVLRGDTEVAAEPDTVLRPGDLVGVTGLRSLLAKGDELIGPEVGDQRVLGDAIDVVDVVVTSKEYAGLTLREIADKVDPEARHGVYLQRVQRQGRTLPRAWGTRIERGDVIRFVGWPEWLNGMVEELGYKEKTTDKTDLVYLAVGVVIGTAVGLLTWKVGGVPLTLGTGGGVLVSGLVFGWLRSRQRRFGSFPPAAQTVFTDFGLAGFVAVVGLTAGPQMVTSMQENGPGLVGIGIGVAVIPQIVGLYFGHLVLRLHPLVLLGGLAGSQTVTAALNAVLEEAESSAPVVGYTVTYAIGNVLLTLWGPVIVAMLA
ncbi:MAG TPA: aspartate-alanine antiporter, partial [Planctomycetota bacterium]|nr:aspartate-alanine antiporter [Planctomycetota bacterium]